MVIILQKNNELYNFYIEIHSIKLSFLKVILIYDIFDTNISQILKIYFFNIYYYSLERKKRRNEIKKKN